MKIEKISIEKIKMYENNAKEHPSWHIEQIKDSIHEFGFNDPIAVDENNVIIEGHGRYLALKELGYKEVEFIRLEHLTEEQKKAYILAHNKLTMNTGFNEELLMLELEEITEIDMEQFGFEEIKEELLTDKYGTATEEQKGNLESKFIIPPFSIIDANKSPWLDIKNKWKELPKIYD